MDKKKVTRRQNRRKPSEDTIAEARRVARHCLEHWIPPTVKGQAKLILEQIKKDIERAGALTPSYWMKALQDSQGHITEYGATCLAATLIERGEPVPPPLRPFIAALLRGVFHPSWGTLAVLEDDNAPKATRDLAVAVAVIEVCHKTELKPTRNVATDTPSACSIVAEVLREFGIDKGEAIVEKIWRRLNKRDGEGLGQEFDEVLPLPPPRQKN